MSNWSDFVTVLQGNAKDIKNAFEELKLKLNNDYLVPIIDPDGYDVVANVSIELKDDEHIAIFGQGRWMGPSEFIKEVFERHNLRGYYADMECGMGWCLRTDFKDGKVVNKKIDRYFSDMSIDMTGISFMVERFSWIPEEENWEEEYKYHIALFEKHGIPLDKLKQAWHV